MRFLQTVVRAVNGLCCMIDVLMDVGDQEATNFALTVFLCASLRTVSLEMAHPIALEALVRRLGHTRFSTFRTVDG